MGGGGGGGSFCCVRVCDLWCVCVCDLCVCVWFLELLFVFCFFLGGGVICVCFGGILFL